MTVLLGHNGAGKSTTFSVLSGIIGPTSGDVFICGQDLKTDLSECQRNVGYCPQTNPLFPKLTVREHLVFYWKLKNSGSDGLKEKIEDLLKDVGLLPKLDVVLFSSVVISNNQLVFMLDFLMFGFYGIFAMSLFYQSMGYCSKPKI